ncbi:hypothetical protein PIROE2DRAFT_6964, partial [Piromyces sp. E2]
QKGGALYFNKGINDEESNNNNSITITNTTFKNNTADYFGGAIYSDFEGLYVADINNVDFISNRAYSGGAIYTSYNKNKTLFNVFNEKIKYENNSSESHGNDYALSPYLINLIKGTPPEIIIKSGNSFPLEFNLKDQFNQYVNDISRYYSNIVLNANIENMDNYTNIEYNVLGNTCYFSDGKCELKELSIFSNVYQDIDNIKLNLTVENNINNNIKINVNKLKILIEKCEVNQIIMYDNHGFYHCEDPICYSFCPVDDTAVCEKSKINNINNPKLNTCKCIDGWIGDLCNKKEYVHIR